MIDRLSAFWSAWHPSVGSIVWGVLVFLLSSVGGLFLAGVFVVNMPADYFRGPKLPPPDRRGGIHGWAARVFKNLGGFLVVLIGLVLALPGVPGPGVLIMLIGLMLMDFPGKHRFERWMVMRPGVLATLNQLRSRYRRPPMLLDETQEAESDARN